MPLLFSTRLVPQCSEALLVMAAQAGVGEMPRTWRRGVESHIHCQQIRSQTLLKLQNDFRTEGTLFLGRGWGVWGGGGEEEFIPAERRQLSS